jgi:hypothetical protein
MGRECRLSSPIKLSFVSTERSGFNPHGSWCRRGSVRQLGAAPRRRATAGEAAAGMKQSSEECTRMGEGKKWSG